MDDDRKYSHMENVLQKVNSSYISLDETLIKQNNKILNKLCDEITSKMKESNPMFKALYTTIYYGGSYYDGLKIAKPEEYDCDLLLTLPRLAKARVEMAEYPGFVQVQLTNMERFKEQPEYKTTYSAFEKSLLDTDHYVRVDKMKQWVESVMHTALKDSRKENDLNIFQVDDKTYYFKIKKSGPAFTANVTDDPFSKTSFMDVDLVPCIVFNETDWPPDQEFRTNPSSVVKTFFVVPKKPTKGGVGFDRYWRLSFQQQEGELISGKQSLKPALKLLKKFRDHYNHKCISSYFLKTVFLWEVDNGDESFWKYNLSHVFIKMLKRYHERLVDGSIPYYWDKRFNLISNVSSVTIVNVRNKVNATLKAIENKISDPFIVATFLIPQVEVDDLKEKVVLGKKYDRKSVDEVDGQLKSPVLPILSTKKLQESIEELDKKLNLILIEQKLVRSLLEEIRGKQTNMEEELKEMKNSKADKDRLSKLTELNGPLFNLLNGDSSNFLPF